MIENIVIFAFLIFVNFIFYKNLNKLSNMIDIYDQPNKDRKIHSSQVPILGGIIFFINIFTYLIYEKFFLNNINFSFEVSNLAVVLFLTFLIGIIDDKKDLNQNLKFLFFLILFGFFLYVEDELLIKNLRFSYDNINLQLGNYSFIFSVICIILFVNAFNMFDGLNGQSAIYIITIFLYFLLQNEYVILSIIIIISSIFYIYNNLKNKTFLGDSGSLTISLLISILIISFYQRTDNFFCEEIFILMMIPGFDLIRLFFIRIINKKNPMKADGNHLHHILMRKFSQKQTLFINSLLVAIPIFLSTVYQNYILIIFLTLLTYSILIYKIRN
tara:strand:+ start:1103 stop:2089 length:987 start_codon:yes stop_codon:yes gene_type:complete